MAAQFIANVIRLKEEGFTPDRDLILALTFDEEGGDFIEPTVSAAHPSKRHAATHGIAVARAAPRTLDRHSADARAGHRREQRDLLRRRRHSAETVALSGRRPPRGSLRAEPGAAAGHA